MKIFISWSGNISQFVAIALADWLSVMESSLETFVSSKEISKGSVWFNEISEILKESAYGIIVLTPDNIRSSWLSFEAGALFRGLTNTRVIPLLIGVKYSALTDQPLAMFQAVTSDRTQVFDLIKQLNALLPRRRTDDQLTKLFDKMWPELEVILNQAVKQTEAYHQDALPTDLITFAKTQKDLDSLSRGIFSVVSTANSLRISGGTFKTFCDDSRNLDAVKEIVGRGEMVRLLMLHPEGEAISMLASMRKDYSPRVTEERIRAEIESSVDRLLDALGSETVKTIVRLYSALPRYGLCITDHYAVVTLYLHGHGASSPSFTLRVDDPQTKEFCSSMVNGFDQSWASTLSRSPDWI